MVQRRNVILGALGAATGLTAAGCSSRGKSDGDAKTPADQVAAGSWQTPAATPITLTVSPAAGAAKVSPADPVVVTVEGGTLQSVAVESGKKKLVGAVESDGLTWRSTGTLAYGKTYKVTASILDSTGAKVEKTSAFTTLKPPSVASITFQANGMSALKTGGTYGIGQPVIVAFSRSVSDKAAAQKAIDIQTTPAVKGKFFWVSDSTVHWRPAKYWAKGTKIAVSVNVLGVHLGKGVYGAADRETHFTIGRALMAINDNNAHRTKVYIDGKLVRDMACSNGRGGYTTIAPGKQIHFWTHNGPHVVLSKEPTHTMSSASYGLTDPKNPAYYAPEVVKLCTRISYSGEFLHAAPWNHSLGRANLSHGCINLSTTDAQWVYDHFIIGDVVDVRHSPKELPIWNGLGDWTVSYDKYGH
jgi:lipoprotein-anchoring transpeptidase ErfK/SrfK